MITLTAWIRRYPLATYFILAYAFAWAFAPLIAISPTYGVPGLFTPALAAYIVSRVAGGREQAAGLFRKLAIFRVNLLWYLVALGLPVLLSFIVALLARFFGAAEFQFAPISPLSAIIFVLVVGEELGWRGFAQPQLEKRFSPLVGALMLGVIWGIWHLPNFFIPGTPHYEIPLPAFILYTVALSVMAAWILKYTRGSVFLATLLHGATNTFGFLSPGLDIVTRWWLIALVYCVAAILIALIFGTRLSHAAAKEVANRVTAD